MITLNLGALEACCCSLWWDHYGCGCNIFGCNCDYAGDDYCYYSKITDPFNPYSIPHQSGFCDLPICRTPERCSSVTLKQESENSILPINEPMMIYTTLDSNRDGYISSEEFGNSSTYLKQFVHHEDTYELFKGLDLNNNGNIEPIEIDDSLKGLMSDLSLDDGSYKHLVPNQYAPNYINTIEPSPYKLKGNDYHPDDNMTTEAYGLNTCFDVQTHTVNNWGHEMVWKMIGKNTNSSCESTTEFANMQIYTQRCCLPAQEVEFELTCYDTFHDGWNNAFIEINGKYYCDKFLNGHNHTITVPNPSRTTCGTDCGPCYGAETKNVPCCDSCNEVIQAHEAKGWTYNVTEFEQCNEFSDMEMIADPKNDELKCYFEGSSMRVFELRGENATFARCTEECLKNYLCVEVSGIWSDWCFGCKFELTGQHFAVGEYVRGARAYKKRKRPVTEVPSNFGIKWNPNVEYIFEFKSKDLIPIPESHEGLSNPTPNFGINMKAQVRVQSFNDHTLRAKLDQVRFYTTAGPITLKTAHEILGANELAYDSYNHEKGVFNEEGEFMKYLEEPMMFSLKRGLVKNMIVSMDEPKCVTKIKKLLLGELQNVNSTFGLKFLKKQPILAVLRTTLKAKKVDVDLEDEHEKSFDIFDLL